jgi:hypothetical protein
VEEGPDVKRLIRRRSILSRWFRHHDMIPHGADSEPYVGGGCQPDSHR